MYFHTPTCIPSYHTHLSSHLPGRAMLVLGGHLTICGCPPHLRHPPLCSQPWWWGDPPLDSGMKFSRSPAFPGCCLCVSILAISSLDECLSPWGPNPESLVPPISPSFSWRASSPLYLCSGEILQASSPPPLSSSLGRGMSGFL